MYIVYCVIDRNLGDAALRWVHGEVFVARRCQRLFKPFQGLLSSSIIILIVMIKIVAIIIVILIVLVIMMKMMFMVILNPFETSHHQDCLHYHIWISTVTMYFKVQRLYRVVFSFTRRSRSDVVHLLTYCVMVSWLDWCDLGEWWYLNKTWLMWLWWVKMPSKDLTWRESLVSEDAF